MQPLPPPGAPVPSRLSAVDTLLGMSTTLWPIIHRLSQLSSAKSDLEALSRDHDNNAKSNQPSSCMKAVLKDEFETNCRAIEFGLEAWQPPFVLADCNPVASYDPASSSPESADKDTDNNNRDDQRQQNVDSDSFAAVIAGETSAEKSRLHSIFNNAMAYRHSSFVYLYRYIRGHPRRHPAVQQHAHTALWHCLQTCAHEGPMGALLWPLFVAACEAVTDEDRGVARRAFGMVERRQGMINIKWAWDIVQEVWRLADLMDEGEYDGGGGWVRVGEGGGQVVPAACAEGVLTTDVSTPHLWRRISEQMGISIVFG